MGNCQGRVALDQRDTSGGRHEHISVAECWDDLRGPWGLPRDPTKGFTDGIAAAAGKAWASPDKWTNGLVKQFVVYAFRVGDSNTEAQELGMVLFDKVDSSLLGGEMWWM
jgi:hypothetical protein